MGTRRKPGTPRSARKVGVDAVPEVVEAMLRGRTGLLRSVFDNSPAVIYAKDREGRYLLVNPSFERLFHLTNASVRGKTGNEIWPPEIAARFRANDRLVMESGAAFEMEEIAPHDDGPHTYISLKFPIRDDRGEIYGVCGISTDITDRKLAEEKLRRSERQLVEAQFYGHVGSWEWDIESDCVTWSAELHRLYGLDPQAFHATYAGFLERVHVDDRERVASAIRTALEHGRSFEFDHRIVLPDSHERTLRCHGSVVLDAVGRPMRLVGIGQDITERRQLEEQLRQSQKMEAVGRLAGGIAHDFNNLLTAITGYSSMILDGLGAQDPARTGLEQIHRAAERGAALTRQLLAFSRRQVLVPDVLDLGVVVTELSKMLWPLIGEDIALSTVVLPRTSPIRADRGQLSQVIMNLAVNARDAMPDGGKLMLEVRNACQEDADSEIDPDAYVLLSVSDTGQGMDDETLRYIFEPFFTTKHAGHGTGLGLATVYGIVEQSGGHIRVTSEVGRGTTFRIFLPRANEQPAMATRSTPASASRGTETVLLVEDEPAVRRLVCEILEAHGYRVIDAGNGSEAMQLLQQQPQPIHLLLTDVVLPGMNGRELAERLGELQPGLRTLYMSGHTDDAVVRRGILTRDAEFIQKPFGPYELAARVRQVLGSG